ncbi:La-related protein 6 [Lonchura striata]|uniref:La-related protein 6 n=1 Tax=Lonchura striata TaxID=40157 RepID=A0A218UDE6_9PASE|nr:la-related protein 6B [Lonchura striata domestica]OWK51422.1 La-related protein 6 [Lonchura striata domestica]
MSSLGSGAPLGRNSQPSCGPPVPAARNSLLAQPLPPPWSRPLALLGPEDVVESCSGSCCELGVALLERSRSGPDPQLVRRIVAQVEFYLSDENLAKDAFLLKHVQKNKMGFVSIKLLTSFKKVKYLTRDWRLTLYALKFSALLEVNREGTKVRRRLPIPEDLLSIPPSKLLLAWELQPREQDLPVQKSFLDTITRMFSPFGAIASIRLLRPGRKLPADVRRYCSRFPELLSRCCALVEYESLESARSAAESLGHGGWPSGRVVRLCGKGGRRRAGQDSPARSFPRGPGSAPQPGDAPGLLSLLPSQEPPAPTWPGGDFAPGDSSAFPGSLLASKGFPPLGMGTESRPGSWTPWGSAGLCPKPAPSDGQWVPEPLGLWDGVLHPPHGPEGAQGFGSSFGREELVLRR